TLLILLLSISSMAFGQNYQGYVPFHDSNAVWIDGDHYIDNSNPNYSYCRSLEYSIVKDTVINSKTYQKIDVNVKEFTNPHNCYPYNYTIHSWGSQFIRNDSLNKKIWLLRGNSDTLLYDFDLQLNQTYPETFLDPDTFMGTVTEIDTIYLYNRWRKRYKISDCNTHYLIEGLGSTQGFMNVNFCYAGGRTLHCMSENNNGVYPDTNTSCQLVTDISEIKTENINFGLYPNPSSGTINLSVEKPLQSIEIYNLQGQKVQEINSKVRSWELPEQSGLYLIRIQDGDGKVYSKKI